MRILYLCLIFAFFLVKYSKAQTINDEGAPYVKNFTIKEYLASAQNWCVVQDKRGIIYVGNTNGMLEYDGKTWKLYQTPNKSIVRDLAIDRNGTLYAGANGEFGYFAIDKTGTLKYVSLLSKLSKEDRKFNDIHKIFPTQNGVYFVSINKLFYYHNDTITVSNLNVASRFGALVHQEVFLLRKEGGIFWLNRNKPVMLPKSEQFSPKLGRMLLAQSANNKLLIVTENSGLFLYDLSQFYENKKFSIDSTKNYGDGLVTKLKSEIDAYIQFNKLYTIAQLSDNQYAIGTINGGVLITNENGQLLNVINKNRGLTNAGILGMCFDRDKNLWVTTQKGISYIELSSPITRFYDVNGISGSSYCFVRHRGRVYAGGPDGINYLPDYKINPTDDNNSFKKIKTINAACWDFFTYKNALFAVGNFGVAYIQDTTAYLYPDFQFSCFSVQKANMFPDHIIFGLTDGITAAKIIETKQPKQPYRFEFIKDGRFKGMTKGIRNICEDKTGNLWLTSNYDGIYRLHFSDLPNIEKYSVTQCDSTLGLKGKGGYHVYNIDNKLILTSSSGLLSAKKTNGDSILFVKESMFEGIFDKMGLAYLSIDKEKNLWFSSERGIGKLVKQNGSTYAFDTTMLKPINREGLLNEMIFDSIGNMWINTNEGLYRFNTSKPKNYRSVFHTLIRKVSIGKDSVIFNGAFFNDSAKISNHIVAASLVQPQQMIPELSYRNNSIIFFYSTNCYEQAEKNNFRYMLEGYDKEWSNWTTETKKEYTNLREGTYYFKVQAKNVYDNISTEAVYQFKISPPWYRTVLAYIIYIISIGLAFYFGIKLNSRRLKAINEHLEKTVKERTAEIQQQKEEISSQAEQLEATNRQLEKLSIVARETDNVVFIFDSNGNLEWVNESFTRVYGFTLDEFIKENNSKNISDISKNPKVTDAFNKCLHDKESVIYESPNVTKNGSNIWFQTTLTPILDNFDNVTKLIAIDSNINKLKVAEQEIIQQSEEIKAQRDELQEQKNTLEYQNENIRASINYALTIQRASLPILDEVAKFVDFFLIYRPKDIVSGDFYWFAQVSNELRVKQEELMFLIENEHDSGLTYHSSTFLAVVDCTGHGVPGAFMSLIGTRLLNEIVNQQKIYDAAKILEKLNELIRNALQQDQTDNNDGMDVCLVRLDRRMDGKTNINFAGAKRNLYWYKINDSEMVNLKADRHSIGGARANHRFEAFTSQNEVLNAGDVIYLSSDGFADQNSVSRKKIGSKRMLEIINDFAKQPLHDQKLLLEKYLDDYQQTEPQRDDITLWGIKV